ncbi:pleckstrin homology domain-containing family B member 2-like, partial [Sinocyclocheilus grahami]|uniref:pleckstrin homology domain-containing family B member 2-like n=1 Tax=Sinocyclocheilus grahami TaxID=75366 RepID=UPI0007AC5725
TILRRWKRNWFDLWSDGRLVFYEDQQRRDMEDEIHMKVDCINIRNASACRGGICADSADDALAWTMALQDARLNTIVPPPQVGFAEDVVASAPPPYSELNTTPQLVLDVAFAISV